MHGYQQANNADKMMDMAQKILNYDPDDPEALLGVAQVLAERTRDTDLDKDQRLAEAKKNAQRALVTVDTDIPTAGLAAGTDWRLSKVSSVRRHTPFWERSSSTPKLGRTPKGDLRKSIDAFPQQVGSGCGVPAVGGTGQAEKISRGPEVRQPGG